MNIVIGFVLMIGLTSLGLCDQSINLQGMIRRVRRTFRSLSARQPIARNELIPSYQNFAPSVGSLYSIQLRPRTPKKWPYLINYQDPPLYAPNPNLISSYRRYRTDIPAISSVEANNMIDTEDQEQLQQSSSDQVGRLRFLGWLFGRPPISPYPDYSVLEQAAGISPYGSRYPSSSAYHYPPSSSSVIVEDCIESLDPYTHEIIEHCQEVPMYH